MSLGVVRDDHAPRPFTPRLATSDVYAAESCTALRVVGDLIDRELSRRVEYFLGVGRSVFDALVVIERSNRAMTPSQVCERTSISGATMTAVVDALEARNWVKRVRNERDRRSVFLVITPEGRATVNQIAPRLREVERHVMSVLTPDERRQLTSLLDRVLARASDLSSGAQSPRAAQRTGGGAR